MGKHAKPVVKVLKRAWWQVIIPAAMLGGIVILAGHSVAQYTSRAPVTPAVPVRPVIPEKPPPAPMPVIASPETYVVAKGDTLWSVARAHCGNGDLYGELAGANHISSPYALHLGEVIILQCGN